MDRIQPPSTAEFWDWFAVALFLLITVDLLTTFGAMAIYGLEAEANPIMKWLLGHGTVVVALAHLGIVVVAAYAFSGVVAVLDRAPDRHRGKLSLAVEIWLGLLIAGGLFLFANNLAVVVLGDSLL